MGPGKESGATVQGALHGRTRPKAGRPVPSGPARDEAGRAPGGPPLRPQADKAQ